MAVVTIPSSGARISDPTAIAAALAAEGVAYERWDVTKYDPASRPEGVDEQAHILDVFAPEIAAISAARGYHAADVVALYPSTPGLDGILAKYDKEHTHAEDEARFVVSGRGVFTVRCRDGEMVEVEAHAGDLLAVPQGAQHHFTLCDDRHIQCIRLFTDPSGWAARYVHPDGTPA